MRHANGGTLAIDGEDWELHPILDETDAKRIARTCNDVVQETKEAQAWAGFPKEALAIASNGAGDRLVLLRSGDDNYGETVYVWNHESQELLELAPAADVFRAA
jgi:hypothetical protein